MSSKPTVFAIRSLVLLAIVAAAPISLPIHSDDADVVGFSRQSGAASTLSAPPSAAPIIVAQGRCFNGRCY
jgi:hypothetical protein